MSDRRIQIGGAINRHAVSVKVSTVGAGIFSKFYIAVYSVMERVAHDIERVAFDIDYKNTPDYWRDVTPPFEDGVNPFDLVFDQDFKPERLVSGQGGIRKPLYRQDHRENLRKLCSHIQLHEDVLNRVPPDINDRTLGVHIRLTDMNTGHADHYDPFEFVDFIKAIEQVRGEYDNIFVACDNEESLQKLPWPVIYNDVVRYPHETADTEFLTDYYYKQIGHPRIWYDSFLEMVCLSRCGGMIYRSSCLNWAAMCFGSPEMNLYPLQK